MLRRQEAAAIFDESVVKKLTGEDTISCRHLFGNNFRFKPTFKLLLATNHKPVIGDVDHAIWRRIQLAPFDVMITANEMNPHLFEELSGEFPGILNWALEGLRSFRHIGLRPPPKVTDATKAYRSQMDVLQDWIDEECICEPGAKTAASVLHKNYCQWACAQGHSPLTQIKFSNNLETRGFTRSKTAKGQCHIGIRLRI